MIKLENYYAHASWNCKENEFNGLIQHLQLPALYCKAVLENFVGFQLLLSAKDYI